MEERLIKPCGFARICSLTLAGYSIKLLDDKNTRTALSTASRSASFSACFFIAEVLPADDPASRAEPKSKDFIGQTIKGKGWRIEFDGAYGKTRVIFTRKPSDGIRELVKAAGFYWSPTLKSWNKGLNWRAYRAALDLAARLRYYPNAPLFAQHTA